MTFDERNKLRADVSAYFQSQQPGQELLPMPAAAPAGLNEAQKQTLFDAWVEHVYSRSPKHVVSGR
jgi:hypothetical protein